jgi:Uma2 family endonuclease
MILGHVGAWSEADYFALGETADRIELVDGNLLVEPVPDKLHQRVCTALVQALDEPAHAVGLQAYRAVNLRLAAGRIVIPDLVVAETDPDGLVVDASEVALVGEVVAVGEAALERLLKAHLYAAAGIRWYLLIEVGSSGVVRAQLMRLIKLDGSGYVEHRVALDGDLLIADSPFAFDLDTGALLPKTRFKPS